MAEELKDGQRVNAAGQVVEYNKDSDRWEPVKDKDGNVQTVETSEPAPDGETVVEEGNTTPRRARKTSGDDK